MPEQKTMFSFVFFLFSEADLTDCKERKQTKSNRSSGIDNGWPNFSSGKDKSLISSVFAIG